MRECDFAVSLLPATSGRPAPKSAEAEELARLRAENKKLKSRNDRLESELGKTKTALDIAGKAFALLDDVSRSADSGEN
jgi:transposase